MRISPKLLIILAVLFWSGNFFLGKIAVQVIPPMTLSFIRWLQALLIFFPFCIKEIRENHIAMKENWKLLLMLGATGMTGFNVFVYLAVKHTTAINATIINASTPMFTAILAVFMLGDRLKYQQALGILLAFLGVIWIITTGKITLLMEMSFNPGDLLMLIAVVFNTMYFILLKLRGFFINPKILFLGSMVGGLMAGLPLMIIENYIGGFSWLALLEWEHYLSLLYLGVFPTILSFLFFNRAVLEIGPVKASIYLNLQIVFTSLLGIAFLGERLYVFHLVGGLLIVAGVWINNSTGVPVKVK